MTVTRSPADPSVPADAGGLASLDLARTRELVEPLYQDRALRTGEPFIAHADGIATIVAVPILPMERIAAPAIAALCDAASKLMQEQDASVPACPDPQSRFEFRSGFLGVGSMTV